MTDEREATMTEKTETLGQRLRRLREGLGLDQEGLAERAGVPLVSYRNWEYDHRLPGLGAASLLAKALGVPLQSLADCVEGQEDRRNRPRGDQAEKPAATGRQKKSKRTGS
jgi:transcriptional regulator with XRE-family HTH domain